MPRLSHILEFFGLRRRTIGMLFMVILVGMGERMAERFLPIYLIAIGGSVLSIGLLNGLDNLLSALYAYPGGYLSDRIGTKRALFVFNIFAILGYLIVIFVPVAYFVDKSTKKPFVVTTFIFFTFFPLVLLFCQSFPLLVLAFILRGLKEFGEPTRKALIMDLAPEDRKAGMFGLYYLMRDVVVSVAAFGGAFLWMLGPTVNFLVAFAFGVAGTAVFAIWGDDQGQGP